MGSIMKRSTERILTTHAGSLPRPPELLRLLNERAEGRPVDGEADSEHADEGCQCTKHPGQIDWHCWAIVG